MSEYVEFKGRAYKVESASTHSVQVAVKDSQEWCNLRDLVTGEKKTVLGGYHLKLISEEEAQSLAGSSD